jgi:hypothetical protein
VTMSFWIKPHPRGWTVFGATNPTTDDVYSTRDEAISVGRHAARLTKGELVICGEDGLPIGKETYEGEITPEGGTPRPRN